MGLQRSSACKLKYPYNGCNNAQDMSEFCYKNSKNVNLNNENSANIQFFDEPVLDKKINVIEWNTEGIYVYIYVCVYICIFMYLCIYISIWKSCM